MSRASNASAATGMPKEMGRRRGADNGGTASPRDVVVTETETVPLPFGRKLGVTVYAVAAAGTEQLKSTGDENPFSAETVTALLNDAVVPAATVTVAVPLAAIEKSGGGVTVKLRGPEEPADPGSTAVT